MGFIFVWQFGKLESNPATRSAMAGPAHDWKVNPARLGTALNTDCPAMDEERDLGLPPRMVKPRSAVAAWKADGTGNRVWCKSIAIRHFPAFCESKSGIRVTAPAGSEKMTGNSGLVRQRDKRARPRC